MGQFISSPQGQSETPFWKELETPESKLSPNYKDSPQGKYWNTPFSLQAASPQAKASPAFKESPEYMYAQSPHAGYQFSPQGQSESPFCRRFNHQ